MERFYCSTFLLSHSSQCFIQHTRSNKHFFMLKCFYLILTHSYSDGCILGSYLAQAYFKPSADASLHLQSSSRRISWKLICISTTNSWNWCVMCRVGEQVKWSVWHVSSQLLEIWCLVRLEINLHESCLERWVIVCVHINYMSSDISFCSRVS